MRNQRGITLSSIMIYVIIAIMVTALIGTVVSFFIKNVAEMNKSNIELAELDKFNTYFLQDVKNTGNDIKSISENLTKVEFTSGNTYSFADNAIYLNNNIKISEKIENCTFSEVREYGKKIILVKITINGKEYINKYVLGVGKLENNITDENEFANTAPRRWVQNVDETITDTYTGLTVKIGDFVNYDSPTDYENPDVSGNKKGWRILGVEKGNLLLIADTNAEEKTLEGKDGYLNGVTELNEICQKYKDDIKVVSARSVKVEDINKITGYNPLCVGVRFPTEQQIENGDKFNDKKTNQYANKVKYTIKNDGYVYYQYETGAEMKSTETTFTHVDGTKLVTEEEYDVAEDKTGIAKQIEIYSNEYYYFPNTLTVSRAINDENPVGLSTQSAAYDMIYNKYDGKKDNYWLATIGVGANPGYLSWIIFNIYDSGNVGPSGIWYSHSGNYTRTYGVRPVLTLSPSVQLTNEKDVEGKIGVKSYDVDITS